MRWWLWVPFWLLTLPLGAQGLDGLWKVQGPGPETIFRFYERVPGEVEAEVVQREGADETTRYFCRNAQFDGLPLLHHPWIRGLKPSGPGTWSGGLAVDIRNDHGNLFYCDLSLTPEGTLVLRSLSGLSEADRTQVFTRWEPPQAPPPQAEPNLQAYLWAESPEVVRQRERSQHKPLLSKEADALAGGFLYYSLIGIVLLVTLVVVMGW